MKELSKIDISEIREGTKILSAIYEFAYGFIQRHKNKSLYSSDLEYSKNKDDAKRCEKWEYHLKEINNATELFQKDLVNRTFLRKEFAKIEKDQKEIASFISGKWPFPVGLLKSFVRTISELTVKHTFETKLHIIPLPLNVGQEFSEKSTKADYFKSIDFYISKVIGDCKEIVYHSNCYICNEKVNTRYANADIMNIHYAISVLPTLLLSPVYVEDINDDNSGTLHFSIAIWDAIFVRPLTIEVCSVLLKKDKIFTNETKDFVIIMESLIIAQTYKAFRNIRFGNSGNFEEIFKRLEDSYIVKNNKKIFDKLYKTLRV